MVTQCHGIGRGGIDRYYVLLLCIIRYYWYDRFGIISIIGIVGIMGINR